MNNRHLEFLWSGVALVFCAALVSCGEGGEESERSKARDLRKNRDKWERQGVTSYEMQQDLRCFCTISGESDLRIKNGAIVEIDGIVDGDETFDDRSEPFYTIDAIFDEIDLMLETEGSDASVTYDEELGYPTEVFLDRSVHSIDDELTITITGFEATVD